MLSDDSDTDIHTLTINEHYAKAFEYRKEREELAKRTLHSVVSRAVLKEQYGSDGSQVDTSEDESTDETEDEDGEELTPAVDAAILRTLARIKRRDPTIYEQGKDVFEEERRKTGDAAPVQRVKKDKSKPLTFRQHVLDSELHGERSLSPEPAPLTHVEEQAALRRETIAVFHDVAEEQDGAEDDGFLVPREKTKDEIEKEEEEYHAFLERELGEDLKNIIALDEDYEADAAEKEGENENEAEEDGTKKKKKRGKGKEKEGKVGKAKSENDQEFLMNYILNRGWIDRSSRRLPTYQEVTAEKEGKKKKKRNLSAEAAGYPDAQSDAGASGSGGDSSTEGDDEEGKFDEDEFDEVADRFESSYNFRFEEPDAATITRYPRNLPSLVRRQDTTRKEARERRKERKEEEILKKREEVKRLKALKMKDLQARLEKIAKEGGKSLVESKALQQLDLDGDWDANAYDRQMAELYEKEESADIDDDEKPQWDDDINIDDIVPPEPEHEAAESKKKKKKKKKKDVEEGGIDEGGVDVDEMDAEVQQYKGDDDEEWDGTEEMRKRKLDEYMDEVYGLEFNDMVGDMPTRFRYTQVAPQAYGLLPVDILLSTDVELNSYMGIKKYAPYRRDSRRTWDATRAARLKDLKDKLRERGIAQEDPMAEKPRKRKGKKERMKEKLAKASPEADGNGEELAEKKEEVTDGVQQKESKQEKTKQKKREMEAEAVAGMDPDGPAKKRRRRHKKSGHGEQQQNT
ncbi:hypothetical protein WOLCODRAFT_126307 [Wolfiporia cocos MD-104 SS10]|uniref:Kri1-like C-terminal domain-containing protein n=1 Tax=Wolfiporia cocos (strain MD-104) TaxID=742152 RepID=A0A2H3J249_WOLCO|nr:hypothetical protein WOLCODRAFT_126307 [Wolfiporia cocos MD-104 SS10]